MLKAQYKKNINLFPFEYFEHGFKILLFISISIDIDVAMCTYVYLLVMVNYVLI